MTKRKNKKDRKTTTIFGIIFITVTIIAIIIQTINPNKLLEVSGYLIAILFIIGIILIKLPIYDYTKKTKKTVKKYTMIEIVSAIPLYILLLMCIGQSLVGGTFFDSPAYGLFEFIILLFLYSLGGMIILLPSLIINIISLTKLGSIKK